MRRAWLAAAALAGCAHLAPPAPGAGARAADVALDAAVAARDAAAFAARVCPEAVFGGRERLSEGREAVRRAWARLLDPAGPALRWAPSAGGEAASGDLAWTVGDWTFRGKDGERRGRYATVWRREGEGWCALLDLGLEPPGRLTALGREPVRSARAAAGDLEAEMGRLRAGPGAEPEGAYLAVRRRAGQGWEVVVDSAVPFTRPAAP